MSCFKNLYWSLRFRCRRQEAKTDDWKSEWHLVEVIDVYDGDTCTVILCRNGQWISQKIRLMGYDTAEMKPLRNKPNRDAEIELAKRARKAFMDHIGYSETESGECIVKARCWMHCEGREKFGRILGTFYRPTRFGLETTSVNDWMIKNGYGIPYSGGTKESHV